MIKRLHLPLLIGIVLVLTAGIAYYVAYSGAQNQVGIAVAGTDLPPFIAVQSNQLKELQVPQASVTSQDMTWSYYQSHYTSKAGDQKQEIIPVYTIISGQRINLNVLAKSPQESFSIVLPDERVVAVTSSVSGAALGVVQPGDVIDASTSGNGGSSITTTFSKVLCISASTSGCRGVVPAGQSVIAGVKSNNNFSSGGPINVLLVVSASDANQIAGQNVALSLNTQCGIDQYGYFTQVRRDYPCIAPTGREASQGAKKSPAQKKTKTGGAQTTTTGTQTSTQTTTTGTQTSTTP